MRIRCKKQPSTYEDNTMAFKKSGELEYSYSTP